VVKAAFAQLPGHRRGRRPGRTVLVRADAAGAAHEFLNWLASQRLSYSVGFSLPDSFATVVDQIPAEAWTPAYDGDGQPREGAWVAEVTDLLDLSSWPAGMRVIIRKERPHPGAQLRLTDIDGHRITAFATITSRGQLADLELRHRARARCEDRIRNTGLTNLPLHDFTQNQIWCAIVALAVELTAWMQMLAMTGHDARRWEPKRLRLRLFNRRAARPTQPHPTTALIRARTLGRATRRHDQPVADTARSRLNSANPSLRTLVHPASGNGATRATSGEPSHPPRTITHQRPKHRRKHDQQRADERSGLGTCRCLVATAPGAVIICHVPWLAPMRYDWGPASGMARTSRCASPFTV
jgi:hypothetical protein